MTKGQAEVKNYKAMAEFKVKPLGARVIVKPIEEPEKTSAGLYLPDTAKEKSMEGEVVAVGKLDDGIELKVGDRVIYQKYAGTKIVLDDEEYLILDQNDVLAVL